MINLSLKDQRVYYLCIVYRPPSGNYAVALNKISDLVNNLRQSDKRHTIIIGGDLNIDISLPKKTPSVKALNNLCRELSLSCVINTPTRYSLTKASILDVFLSNSNIISTHGVVNYNISDHLAIYMLYSKNQRKPMRLPLLEEDHI